MDAFSPWKRPPTRSQDAEFARNTRRNRSLFSETREDAEELGHGTSHRASQLHGEGRNRDLVPGTLNLLPGRKILDIGLAPSTNLNEDRPLRGEEPSGAETDWCEGG